LHIVDVNRRVYVWEMSALAHQFDWLSHMFSSALSSYYYDFLARRATIVMNLSSVTRSYGFTFFCCFFFLPCLLVIDSDTWDTQRGKKKINCHRRENTQYFFNYPKNAIYMTTILTVFAFFCHLKYTCILV
jgi:hypothetical protein